MKNNRKKQKKTKPVFIHKVTKEISIDDVDDSFFETKIIKRTLENQVSYLLLPKNKEN